MIIIKLICSLVIVRKMCEVFLVGRSVIDFLIAYVVHSILARLSTSSIPVIHVQIPKYFTWPLFLWPSLHTPTKKMEPRAHNLSPEQAPIKATLRILFREVIKKLKWKNFNKKRTWIYRIIDQIKNKVLQFPSTSFQILNCYMIVYYKYLLSLWVAMTI